MRFALLGSGSRGNATLVQAGDTLVMVDCGFSCQEAERRLAALGLEAGALDAILLTHEHGDHVRGVDVLARRHGLPVWATAGTLDATGLADSIACHVINSHQAFQLGAMRIRPIPVPHDAREPSQFVFEADGRRLGLLTDTGSLTPHIVQALDGVHGLVLEWNHDSDLLASGPYPPSLKRRVGGDYGHLANHQSRDLLARLDTGRLRIMVAAHISEKNNSLAHVRQAVADCGLHAGCQCLLASQDEILPWQEI